VSFFEKKKTFLLLAEDTPMIRSALALCTLAAAGPCLAQTQLQQAQSHISHIIVIMQENRSFDNYFGTYPGADGIPTNADGSFVECYPQNKGPCVYPFHDRHDINAGGPHMNFNERTCIDSGAMDGFLMNQGNAGTCSVDSNVKCPQVLPGVLHHDAVSYHTADDLPNYWAYAQHFALQDHLFEPVTDWSLSSHMYMTSAWSAACANRHDPMSCVSMLNLQTASTTQRDYAWSSLPDLLDAANVPWKYYISQGSEPDCEDGEFTCAPNPQAANVPSIWNPLLSFDSMQQKNNQQPGYLRNHITPYDQLYLDIKNNALPAIAWVVPNQDESEHPPAGIQEGMEYTTALVNTVMQSPYWNSTVIFIAWDDWGGFLDHEQPPISDYVQVNGTSVPLGYGIRVPGLIISPWVIPGSIDHQVTSFDAYLKFMEDIFVTSARIGAPDTIRPDSRTTLREALTTVAQAPGPGGPGGNPIPVGDLLNDFNFQQTPLPPLVLSTLIPTHFEGTIDLNGIYHFPLTWDAIITGPFIGYNVKRTTTSGSGYQLVTGCSSAPNAPFTATSCTDGTAITGTAYHYIITGIGADGTESPNSAEMDITP
jgi:phospholipase C